MHLFLTGVLPFLAHNHASAVAFLTFRHHNFHSSIIPEFLSDEERVKSFCEARQQDELEADKEKQYTNLYNIFVQTPLMQFSPSLIVAHKDCAESILRPLLETKYFARTLQRCSVLDNVPLTNDLLQGVSKVQSLTKLVLEREVENAHLEIIVNSFPSLETLIVHDAANLDPTPAFGVSSPPPPPATKTLRNLTLKKIDSSFATQFIPYFTNLRKLDVGGDYSCSELDLLPVSSSLPLLKEISLEQFNLKNTASLKNLVHLSSLAFSFCRMSDSLSFLTQNNTRLSELIKLRIEFCSTLSPSPFASIVHAPNLHTLEVASFEFNNTCLQYLENMVHLRKLNLKNSNITGDSRLFKTLMQNSNRLEELNLCACRDVGSKGAIAGALYIPHSRLRVLNLRCCKLVDDDLNGIGALKNTLEVLDLAMNRNLTSEGLVHCKDLMKLKILDLYSCVGINDLSPLKDCLSLEELNVSCCTGLTDDSFKVFSEEPNSLPKLRVLDLSSCRKLTEKVFEHLTKNNHLVYQLKELEVWGSDATARNHICELKGLRRLTGCFSGNVK